MDGVICALFAAHGRAAAGRPSINVEMLIPTFDILLKSLPLMRQSSRFDTILYLFGATSTMANCAGARL